MNTFHSVVLRCAVQYRFGYESLAYKGAVSSGTICDVGECPAVDLVMADLRSGR